MLKVMSVVGTRPEAVKMAPVIKELERHPDAIAPVVCTTAQHREMLDQVLSLFGIAVDYDLDLMRPDQSLPQLTARILTALDDVIVREQPDWVLVQGDTTTVMVASLVAFYRRAKVGHVEAGLRTDDRSQPFPEEINRRIADMLSDLYFAPTENNRERLLREGVSPQAIVVTGNTVVDALLMMARRVSERPLDGRFGQIDGKRLILVTAHRRENFGTPLTHICGALRTIAERYRDDVHIVYPVHFNPNIYHPVHQMLGGIPNISLVEPVDYATLVSLLSQAYLVLTDSGGLQEESPSLHKPVLVLREVTERSEVIALGAARLVGANYDAIVRETVRLLEDPVAYHRMASVENPYGDGRASQRIVQAILTHSQGVLEARRLESRAA
ncbi:MAG TPA: UDP-N-acetylglucosamine 2-epimerase (non-hydrolyzing) [Anaerolineae bacterium]